MQVLYLQKKKYAAGTVPANKEVRCTLQVHLKSCSYKKFPPLPQSKYKMCHCLYFKHASPPRVERYCHSLQTRLVPLAHCALES